MWNILFFFLGGGGVSGRRRNKFKKKDIERGHPTWWWWPPLSRLTLVWLHSSWEKADESIKAIKRTTEPLAAIILVFFGKKLTGVSAGFLLVLSPLDRQEKTVRRNGIVWAAGSTCCWLGKRPVVAVLSFLRLVQNKVENEGERIRQLTCRCGQLLLF